MAQCIFVVEEASPNVLGLGVDLHPYFALDLRDDTGKQPAPARLRLEPCPVVLRRPDGTTLACTLRTGSLHVVPVNFSDPHWYRIYWLPGIQPDQVPPGTEVWVEDADLLWAEEAH